MWVPPPLQRVEELAARGLRNKEIALVLGIHQYTLIRKRRDLANFNEAIERGRANGISVIASKYFEAARDGDMNAAWNWLKAVAGWRDRSDVNVNAQMDVVHHQAEAANLQDELVRHLTSDERAQLLDLTNRAKERMKAAKVAPAAIETTAKEIEE